MNSKFRLEKDFIGKVKVPKKSYFGCFTARALENFKISKIKASKDFFKALIVIKKAAAITNSKLGVLDKNISDAIVKASNEALNGKFDSFFQLDVYQSGAGTPFNMNVNEILANRASEILGHELGSYFVNPNNHVNMSQSSNDVIPSSIRLSVLLVFNDFIKELNKLSSNFRQKSKIYKNVLKIGRTHIMDAVPITFGQEFESYSDMINNCIKNINQASETLRELSIGGTAVGTGINTHPKFRQIIIKEISKLTKIKVYGKRNPIELSYNMNDFVLFSNSLRVLSLALIKICDDLRFMNSGPIAGISEIVIPEVQPGSSIMPGKVNPSIPEACNMICYQVIGNDVSITLAAKSGNLELNVNTPLIMHNILFSIDILKNGVKMLNEKCIKGMKINEKRCSELLNKSFSYITALNPYLGYNVVSFLVRESIKKNKPIKDIIIEKDLINIQELENVLSTKTITKPRLIDRRLLEKIRSNKNYIKLLEEINKNYFMK